LAKTVVTNPVHFISTSSEFRRRGSSPGDMNEAVVGNTRPGISGKDGPWSPREDIGSLAQKSKNPASTRRKRIFQVAVESSGGETILER
jgi:hypothetical protein